MEAGPTSLNSHFTQPKPRTANVWLSAEIHLQVMQLKTSFVKHSLKGFQHGVKGCQRLPWGFTITLGGQLRSPSRALQLWLNVPWREPMHKPKAGYVSSEKGESLITHTNSTLYLHRLRKAQVQRVSRPHNPSAR